MINYAKMNAKELDNEIQKEQKKRRRAEEMIALLRKLKDAEMNKADRHQDRSESTGYTASSSLPLYARDNT